MPMSTGGSREIQNRAPGWRVALGILWPFAAAAGLVAAFYTIGEKYAGGFPLDLGSFAFPHQGVRTFIAVWSCFSALAAGALALSLSRMAVVLAGRTPVALADDRLLIAVAAIAGLAIPLSVRFLLVGNASFADDESSYRFMGELIASGRLYVDSHPMPDFFSRGFMINDGRFYAQYFLGWPAILAVGTLFGVPWLMSPLCSSLTAVAAVLVARRVVGSAGARVVLLVYLASPMLMLGAVTDLSHTSCITALAWTTWFFLRSREPDAPPWAFAGMAACFGLAFFIRPLSALGVGAPFVLFGVWPLLRRPRARELLAFAVPGFALAALFLLVNQLQNGSPFTTAYQRIVEVAAENEYQFSGMPRHFLESGGDVPGLRDEFPWHAAISANTLFRLDVSLFGWPSSLLIALLALGAPQARWFRASAVFFLTTHFFQRHSGIDTFGPVYFMELAWPVLILTGVGYRAAADVLADARPAAARYFPAALVIALVLVALAGYAPARVGAMRLIAYQTNFPQRAVRELADERIVVFAQRPFIAQCRGPGNFLLWRPNNDPDLENDILWANHLDVERNRELMALFPDRVGYVMLWKDDCNVELLPLAELEPGSIPMGYTGPQEASPPLCNFPWRCYESDLLTVRAVCEEDPPEANASVAMSDSTTLVEFSWNPRHMSAKRYLDLWPANDPTFVAADVRGLERWIVELDNGRIHSWRINTQMGRWRSEGWRRFETPECSG